MPGFAVHGADHAIRRDLAGDPPPPVRPAGIFGRLHILPGRQRQQAQSIRGRGIPFRRARACQGLQHREGIIDQVAD